LPLLRLLHQQQHYYSALPLLHRPEWREQWPLLPGLFLLISAGMPVPEPKLPPVLHQRHHLPAMAGDGGCYR
ncbi:hypothetical protein C3S91_005653, partial [Escherichia coli]|nr:hypothetical protein [Escherichia coli]